MQPNTLLHPIKVTFLLLISIGLLMLIPIKTLLIQLHFSDFQARYIGLFFKMSLIFFISYLLIKRLEYDNISGISPDYKWKYKSLNLIPFYILFLGIASVISIDFTEVIPFNLLLLLLACLAIGFAEEFLFRGFLQGLFLRQYLPHKRGLFIAPFSSAVAFGMFHLFNLFGDTPMLSVLVQVIYATFIGFFFGVVLLKTNKIVPLAITHALIDFVFSLQFLPGLPPMDTEPPTPSTVALISPILITLPLFLSALIILAKINKEELSLKF